MLFRPFLGLPYQQRCGPRLSRFLSHTILVFMICLLYVHNMFIICLLYYSCFRCASVCWLSLFLTHTIFSFSLLLFCLCVVLFTFSHIVILCTVDYQAFLRDLHSKKLEFIFLTHSPHHTLHTASSFAVFYLLNICSSTFLEHVFNLLRLLHSRFLRSTFLTDSLPLFCRLRVFVFLALSCPHQGGRTRMTRRDARSTLLVTWRV